MLSCALREKEISREEGDSRLSPSSTMLLGLVLFGYLFCVFSGVLCEIVICFQHVLCNGNWFSLIEEGV